MLIYYSEKYKVITDIICHITSIGTINFSHVNALFPNKMSGIRSVDFSGVWSAGSTIT